MFFPNKSQKKKVYSNWEGEINIELEELILKAKSDKRAFDKTMNIYSPYIYRLCKRLCKNKFDADDLFQNTWLKIYKNINNYDCNNKFENWIYTICLNNYRDNYNKKKKLLSKVRDLFSSTEEKDIEMNKICDPSPNTDAKAISNLDCGIIRNYVNELKDIYRIPIILFYFKDLTYADISEITKVPIGTVKSRLSSAKVKLKKMMEDDYG